MLDFIGARMMEVVVTTEAKDKDRQFM